MLVVWREALVWLALHDQSTSASSKRAQIVAARALYTLVGPDDA